MQNSPIVAFMAEVELTPVSLGGRWAAEGSANDEGRALQLEPFPIHDLADALNSAANETVYGLGMHASG